MSTFHARVDAAQFHEALGNVLRFSAKRSSLPILAEANVCIQNGRCVLTCTNLNQWCIQVSPKLHKTVSACGQVSLRPFLSGISDSACGEKMWTCPE